MTPGPVRRVARAAGWSALALALGLGSAWGVLRSAEAFGAAAGPWHVSLLAGSADADPYTRARVALGGLLALNREETMYYVARTDSDGRRLRSRCTYRLTGTPPAARWWSVTAYAEDFFLFPNAERRWSVNGGNAPRDAAGRFGLVTAPERPATEGLPWLPTPGDRGLLFTLRVYHPEASLAAAPHRLDPPRIERIGDCA